MVERAAGLEEGLWDCCGGLQRLQRGRGGKVAPGGIYAYGGDGAVARGIKAMGPASRWPLTAPPLWQAQAVFARLVGGFHF